MINAISKREYTGTNFDTLMVNGAVEGQEFATFKQMIKYLGCLLYTSPSPRDVEESRMPSSA